MHNYKKALITVFILMQGLAAIAQANSSAGSANNNVMESAGKIYVVMAVVLTILAGLLIYVYRLDRKISRMEKGENL